MIWSIDGIEWNYPCTIKREAEITSSDISGLMLNRTYFNDVVGTYMRYTVAIAVPRGEEADYSSIYEKLSDPDSYHEFNLPYSYRAEGITFNGMVRNVNDEYVRVAGDSHTWRKTEFDVIAVTPTKTYTDGDIQNYGLAPYPDVPSPEVGTLFEYTEYGWEQRLYSDADEVSY